VLTDLPKPVFLGSKVDEYVPNAQHLYLRIVGRPDSDRDVVLGLGVVRIVTSSMFVMYGPSGMPSKVKLEESEVDEEGSRPVVAKYACGIRCYLCIHINVFMYIYIYDVNVNR